MMAATPSPEVLAAFKAGECRVNRLGHGNINDTYLVSPLSARREPFVLQRINRSVFPDPENVLHNFQLIGEHVLKRRGRVQLSLYVASAHGEPSGAFFRDSAGDFWRTQSYFTDFQPAVVGADDDAYRIGRALAGFHRLIIDIDLTRLHDPLPGFHDLPGYLRKYETVLQNQVASCLDEDLAFCRTLVARYKALALGLAQAEESGRIGRQPIHGDPKCDNFLFHPDGEGVAVIDLDTVGAGLVPYDLGDCLRSLANRAGESAGKQVEVALDLDLCRAFAAGYAAESDIPAERLQNYFYTGLMTVTYELAVRFLTDHLEGDVYFKAAYTGQNLEKAVAQFRLLESVVSQEQDLCRLLGRR